MYRVEIIKIKGDDFGYLLLKEECNFNMDRFLQYEDNAEYFVKEDLEIKVIETNDILEVVHFMHNNEFSFDYDSRRKYCGLRLFKNGVLVYES